VVYTVRITSKVEPRESCFDKKYFDEKNFSERVDQLKVNLTDETGSANNISGNSVIKLNGTGRHVKLINDYENKRWFEFAVFGADDKKPDVKNFLVSLKTEKSINGIEIGRGAERVFGDEAAIVEEKITDGEGKVKTVKQMTIKIESGESKGVAVILKPRPNYTDAARQNKVQGRVILRVIFLANGGIGNIDIVSGLKDGLTEEAVKAAKKIAFIPAQRNGTRYSVTKAVEYTFSIY